MKLSELRKKCERHYVAELEVVKNTDDGHKIVFVILTDGVSRSRLHRYYQSADGWEVSVDVDSDRGIMGLRECFSVLNDYFKELIPEEDSDE